MLPSSTLYADFLMHLLSSTADTKALEWIRTKQKQLSENFALKSFYLAFATAARIVGRKQLVVSDREKQQADSLRKAFNPSHWTADQVARAILLLAVPQTDAVSYKQLLNPLFETGDVAELVALYKATPLLPFPEAFVSQVSEGIRTNIAPVFEAIALQNPYPADYLDQPAWNQMVLKAVFIDKPLQKIIGLRQRANANLAQMLSDFARERWAAGRPVKPDLWLPVSNFINDALIADLQKLIASEELAQRLAAALVCRESANPAAKNLLHQHPELQQLLAQGLDWNDLYALR
ncbi:MAG: EboA domain-containing protein [Cytophagales bacterium]|nr:EboA domain-containing protein [Bernardetiaceae bacterium]MDW8203852.1 EboA domain-containing protein [Cytophagales bacterium]